MRVAPMWSERDDLVVYSAIRKVHFLLITTAQNTQTKATELKNILRYWLKVCRTHIESSSGKW